MRIVSTISCALFTLPIGSSLTAVRYFLFRSAIACANFTPFLYVAFEGRVKRLRARYSSVRRSSFCISDAVYVNHKCSSLHTISEPSSNTNRYPTCSRIGEHVSTLCVLPSSPNTKSPTDISPIRTNPRAVGIGVVISNSFPPPAAPPYSTVFAFVV